MDTQLLFIVGRATADSVELESKSNSKFAKFTLAVNEFVAKEKKVTYFDVLVFGKSSESVLEKVKKGDRVIVQGKPEVDAYMSKKDKEPKASITVLADSWKVLK